LSIQHINATSNRLSLRPPQRHSLEILARVREIVSLAKDADAAAALEAVKSEFATVEEFERDFPSLCFALATGVGKTRLMGAFITYLFQSEGIRNFFVLAPNLTIYNKLITDFTPNTSKYGFKGTFEEAISGGAAPTTTTGTDQASGEQRKLFEKPEEQEVAKATYQVIKQYERLKGSDQLQEAAVQEEIVQKVQEIVRPKQGVLEGIVEQVNVAEVVSETTALYRVLSIDVPKIVVVPKGEVTCGYEDFDLDTRNINLQPVAQDILIQHLHENQRYRLEDGSGIIQEKRPEDYLVRGLIDFDDVSYDEHAGLLYKLAGQVVARLREYLTDEDDVINVLQYHQQTLVNLIHSQMQQHFVESATAYEAHVTRGFHTLRANNYSAAANENVRDFRTAVPEGQRNRISSMVFGGFSKCLYPIQKFDSDSERRFAVLLENEDDVLKWFKPAKGDFQIHYSHEDSYEPDFVVETKTEKLLCEPERASEMTDETVLAKADAAATWCKHATDHANENGGKPWRYLLIAHDQIQDQMTLTGLAARCEVIAPQ